MLMVVFGAGASHDSIADEDLGPGANHDFKPPLSNKLFRTRQNYLDAITRFPECAPAISSLRDSISKKKDLEEELEALQRAGGHNTRFVAAIQFYLQDIIRQCEREWPKGSAGVTNYIVLLNSIERWRLKQANSESVLLVTFNYDTLLEGALRAFGVQLHKIDDYVDSTQSYYLIKPHGSTNWGRYSSTPLSPSALADPEIARHEMIELAPLKLSDEYKILDNENETCWMQMPESEHAAVLALAPALSIPMAGKKTESFNLPPLHLDCLKQQLPKISKVLIIGWRANEQHFLNLWKDTAPGRLEKVVAVMGSKTSADSTIHKLDQFGLLAPGVGGRIPMEGGFSSFVRENFDNLMS